MKVILKDATRKKIERLVELGFFSDPGDAIQASVDMMYTHLLAKDFERLSNADNQGIDLSELQGLNI